MCECLCVRWGGRERNRKRDGAREDGEDGMLWLERVFGGRMEGLPILAPTIVLYWIRYGPSKPSERPTFSG